jgi:hypothetical protein
MHENEHDEIKPAEYKELGNFKETPGYTPALDPVSKFETFEGYGAEDMVEPPADPNLISELDPTPGNTPDPEPTSEPEPAPESPPDSSHFAELAGFKEVDSFPEPDWEPEPVTDFTTGHWAVESKPQGEAPQTIMDEKQAENPLNPDDIPTIPPQPEDLPAVIEPQAEPLHQAVEVVDPQATVLASTAFAASVDEGKEGTQPVITSQTQPNKVARQAKPRPAPEVKAKKPKTPKPPKG